MIVDSDSDSEWYYSIFPTLAAKRAKPPGVQEHTKPTEVHEQQPEPAKTNAQEGEASKSPVKPTLERWVDYLDEFWGSSSSSSKAVADRQTENPKQGPTRYQLLLDQANSNDLETALKAMEALLQEDDESSTAAQGQPIPVKQSTAKRGPSGVHWNHILTKRPPDVDRTIDLLHDCVSRSECITLSRTPSQTTNLRNNKLHPQNRVLS